MFRTIHRWYHTTNDEIPRLPKCKSIDKLTQTHWSKIILIVLRTNPAVFSDFLQHKMYLLYIYEYYNHFLLLKEKRSILNKGKTSKRITHLFHNYKFSFFDYVLGF